MDKNKWPTAIAEIFANFLEYTLQYCPRNRSPASECLKHPFLMMDFNYSSLMPIPVEQSESEIDPSEWIPEAHSFQLGQSSNRHGHVRNSYPYNQSASESQSTIANSASESDGSYHHRTGTSNNRTNTRQLQLTPQLRRDYRAQSSYSDKNEHSCTFEELINSFRSFANNHAHEKIMKAVANLSVSNRKEVAQTSGSNSTPLPIRTSPRPIQQQHHAFVSTSQGARSSSTTARGFPSTEVSANVLMESFHTGYNKQFHVK